MYIERWNGNVRVKSQESRVRHMLPGKSNEREAILEYVQVMVRVMKG
jgi:hypothetical protein